MERPQYPESVLRYGKKIGKGSFSDVFEVDIVRRGAEPQKAALKRVTNNAREIEYLSQFRSKYIIGYLGYVLTPIATLILMELAPRGDLQKYLQKLPRRLPLSQRWSWIIQAMRGVEYLHDRNIVHRDIKSPNYLIGADNLLKLADFGLARDFDKTMTTNGHGTARWMAPEVIKYRKRSKKADVFAVGVVTWEIWTGEFPYAHIEIDIDVMNSIWMGGRPKIPSDVPPKLRAVLKACWQKQYKKRPEISGLFQMLDLKEEESTPTVSPTSQSVTPYISRSKKHKPQSAIAKKKDKERKSPHTHHQRKREKKQELSKQSSRSVQPKQKPKRDNIQIFKQPRFLNATQVLITDDILKDIPVNRNMFVFCSQGRVIQEIERDVKKFDVGSMAVQTVVIHVGTNDLTSGSPGVVIEKHKQLIKTAKEVFNCQIVMSAVLPRNDQFGGGIRHKVARYNDMLCETCCKEGVSFIDMTAECDVDHSELFRLNRLHLSRRGTKKLDKVLAMLLKWLGSNECYELHLINGMSKDLRQYSLHDRPDKAIALFCSGGSWSVVSFGKTMRSESYTCRKLNSVHEECWSLVPKHQSGKRHRGMVKLNTKEIKERYPPSDFAMVETTSERDVVALVHWSKCCFPYNKDEDLTTDTSSEEETLPSKQQDMQQELLGVYGKPGKKTATRRKQQRNHVDSALPPTGAVSKDHESMGGRPSLITTLCRTSRICVIILYFVVLYILHWLIASN